MCPVLTCGDVVMCASGWKGPRDTQRKSISSLANRGRREMRNVANYGLIDSGQQQEQEQQDFYYLQGEGG